MQSSFNIKEENGAEDESADLQLTTQPRASSTNGRDSLHYCNTLLELPPHLTSLELTTAEEAPAGPSEPVIRPQRRDAQRQ